MYGNARKFYITTKEQISLLELLGNNTALKTDPLTIIQAGGVWLERKRLDDPEQIILVGQTLVVYTCHTQGKEYILQPEQVIFEDDDLLVLNKPAGLTTISDRSNNRWNLTEGARRYLKKNGNHYLTGAINRLDFMVQGLVIYAKNPDAQRAMFKITEQREIGKIYLALLERRENPPKCLRVQDKINFLSKAYSDEEKGKPAHSLFIYRHKLQNADCYSVMTFTGRRHQIRFHAAKYLAPIIGDEFYGGKFKTKQREIALIAYGYNFNFKKKCYRIRLDKAEEMLSKLSY